MPYFPTNSINIYRWIDSTTDDDPNQNNRVLTFQSCVDGDNQQMSVSETMKMFGPDVVTSYEVFLDNDVDVLKDDIIMLDDAPEQYKVFGRPDVLSDHIMITMKEEFITFPVVGTP
jgi:hypothetical protein